MSNSSHNDSRFERAANDDAQVLDSHEKVGLGEAFCQPK